MRVRKQLHEDYERSCKVLAQLISEQTDANLRRLMLEDFVSKCQLIRPQARSHYLSKALASFAPREEQDLVKEAFAGSPEPKPYVDLAVVTVKQPELLAGKIAFGIDVRRKEDLNVNGLRYWLTKCASEDATQELSVVITMVGEARTVPCAIACERLFSVYDVGACFLVGIGAGLKGKVQIGDVVASELVLDYEGQRLEPDGPKKRPVPYTPEVSILRDLQHFNPNEYNWLEMFGARLRQLAEHEKVPTLTEGWKQDFHIGVVLAGEKLFADGSLPAMREEYHNKVRSVEMEGSGFARSCREHSKPWLVFRGISDFGDPDKPGTEEWQATAALSAATAAMIFAINEYRPKEEREF